MRSLTKISVLLFRCRELARVQSAQLIRGYSSAETKELQNAIESEEFRTLDILKKEVRKPRRRREQAEVPAPRYKKMSVTQDWPSVWPVAKTFHPASVPLPLHQGYVPANKAVPNKFGNLELMKIANFLHLTPPAITRHCEALKQFCTPWPEGLETEREIDHHFPLTIVSNDYCHSTPSIRDHRARIITLRLKLSTLKLDEHARDKFLRLVGDRYDAATDTVTIVADSCPLRKQNLDYAFYLLTALYHESWNVEPWEDEKQIADMEKYIWDNSPSQKRIQEILNTCSTSRNKPAYLNSVSEGVDVYSLDTVKKYGEAITKIHNQGESDENIEDYNKSVRELFNLPAV